MNIKLKTLTLYCKKSTEIINFNENLSYFHGRIGSGKSTIFKLINFCFGQDFQRTPAIQSEGISVQLECQIGDYQTLLERNLSENNEVRITWKKGEIIESILAQIRRQRNPIYSNNIFCLSDLLFFLMGSEPVKFRRSTKQTDSPLVTMTFRNLMWYCYLEQDEIDSSFYNLDELIKKEHSKNVMKYVFGDHSEKLNELEVELAKLRDKRLTNENTVEKLKQFLEQYGYDSVEKIDEDITNLSEKIAKLTGERDQLRSEIMPKNHVIDELKEKLRNQEKILSEKQNQITDLASRISREKSLKYDYINSKFKINKSSLTLRILTRSDFEICPQCGNDVQQKESYDVCPLCKQRHLPFNEEKYVKNVESLRSELDEKIDELDEIIKQHEKALEISKVEIKSIDCERNALQEKLNSLMKDYDSIYLSQVLEVEKEISVNEEKIRNFQKIKLLPVNIDSIQTETDEIIVKERNFSRMYDEERKKLTFVDDYIHELEVIFLNTLIESGFPGIFTNDKVEISRKTWMPTIQSSELGMVTWDFYGVGSGGKKTLFNTCYAIALHVLAEKRGLNLPRLLIIDTPMKNIPEGTNEDIFNSFYSHLYELMETELINTQILIVDKEFFKPPTNFPFEIFHRYMSSNDEDNPGLISYWKEESFQSSHQVENNSPTN